MVKLTDAEKAEMCSELAGHLSKLRKLLNLTQENLSNISGISRVTISQIESGKVKMTWLHLNAILCISCANIRTKEYLIANNLLGPRYMQYIQCKNENEYPELNVAADINKIQLSKILSLEELEAAKEEKHPVI
ncbi:MAG: helix-turn-helix transcriptional regulator [Papillibacter sp.]|nr:helix-turn-helix transcriptional regulator [Papillibacter sp.]